MAVQPSDICFFLSGGSFNDDPNKSIGGEPSNAPILSGLNGLFSDVSKQQAKVGHTDYRCIYVYNRSHDGTLAYAGANIPAQTDGGATCSLGIVWATEVQNLVISTLATSGSFVLRQQSNTCEVAWSDDAQQMAKNIADAINTTAMGLSGVQVVPTTLGPHYVFQLSFSGSDDHKSHALMEVLRTNLNAEVSYDTVRVTHGSPINSVAFKLGSDTTEPQGASWFTSQSDPPLVVGTLSPGDGFPLWIRRKVLRDSVPLQNDGIVVKITGQS